MEFLTNCILNVFKNFVPNRVITVKEKDAPWMTSEIKQILLEKAKIYKKYIKSGRNDTNSNQLRNIINKSSALLRVVKSSYLFSILVYTYYFL